MQALWTSRGMDARIGKSMRAHSTAGAGAGAGAHLAWDANGARSWRLQGTRRRIWSWFVGTVSDPATCAPGRRVAPQGVGQEAALPPIPRTVVLFFIARAVEQASTRRRPATTRRGIAASVRQASTRRPEGRRIPLPVWIVLLGHMLMMRHRRSAACALEERTRLWWGLTRILSVGKRRVRQDPTLWVAELSEGGEGGHASNSSGQEPSEVARD